MYSLLPGAKKSFADLSTHSSTCEMRWWWIGLSVNYCPRWCRLAQVMYKYRDWEIAADRTSKDLVGLCHKNFESFGLTHEDDRCSGEGSLETETQGELANPWKTVHACQNWDTFDQWPPQDKYDKYSPAIVLGILPLLFSTHPWLDIQILAAISHISKGVQKRVVYLNLIFL